MSERMECKDIVNGTATVEAKRAVVRAQIDQWVGQAKPWLTCTCGKQCRIGCASPAMVQCLYCGIWFCRECAEKHFAEDARNEAIRASNAAMDARKAGAA